MTSENTTINTPAAILTEKELFAQFLKMEVRHLTSFGGSLAHFIPDGLLRYSGDGLEYFTDLGERLGDMLEADDTPASSLEDVIDDLECYTEGLRLILSSFEALKAAKLILPQAPEDSDEESAEAWEKACEEAEANPRYHQAAETDEVQEAA